MERKKDELLWTFLNKVPDRFLNVDHFLSEEKIVKMLPGRFVKSGNKRDKDCLRRALQDHRVPVRFF